MFSHLEYELTLLLFTCQCHTLIYKYWQVFHIDEGIRDAFCPKIPLVAQFVVNWLPDSDATSADRMPVVVSGKNHETLLAKPKLSGSGTGVSMRKTLCNVEVLKQWGGLIWSAFDEIRRMWSSSKRIGDGVHFRPVKLEKQPLAEMPIILPMVASAN
jgi:hypothetical protein